MNVMAIASSIGLAADDRGEFPGTIDERTVLSALSALSADRPADDDLFADAALRVQLARSAGVEQVGPNTVFNRTATAATVQLRYRAEMADVFTDLAIDLGLRDARRLAETPA